MRKNSLCFSFLFAAGFLFFFTPEALTQTDALYVDPSGNIGLGTLSPLEKLHVLGYLQLTEVPHTTPPYPGFNGIKFNYKLSNGADYTWRMSTNSNGTGSFNIGEQPGGSLFWNRIMIESMYGGSGQYPPAPIVVDSEGNFLVTANAEVGGGLRIDGNSQFWPLQNTKGVVYISSGINALIGPNYYVNSTGAGSTGSSTYSGLISLWADNRVVCEELNVVSDERMKNIQGRSAGAADLETLEQIEITDYTMRNALEERSQKKLIGQQLREVYPQAVSLQTNAVADVLQWATAKEGKVLFPGHDFQKGEGLQVVFQEGEQKVLEVLEVEKDAFYLKEVVDGKVFIYGREVDDFHVVDYDAVAMLNVSATQELYKRLQEQEKLNKDLQEKNALLEERLSRLEVLLISQN